MRILLDENVPHPLMRYLSGHEVATVQSRGWRGILNGELLRIADESFDVFILADKNLRYQQNMDGRQIAIIELPTPRPVGSTRRRAPAPRSKLSAFQRFSFSVSQSPATAHIRP